MRGNGKIIQELEADFRGAGWNVIKVIWGSYWDPLLAKDKNGLLLKRMEEAVDGEYQTFKSKDGAYVRKHFFGKYPELLEMVANMSATISTPEPRRPIPTRCAAYAAAGREASSSPPSSWPRPSGYGMGGR